MAVYIHTPFCPSKCGYCDFNSYALDGEIVPRTVAAIIREIEGSPWEGRPAKTIFFGGGTPTFLNACQLESILQAVLAIHPPIRDAEITSEANPSTIDAEKFSRMRAAGFNRVSLGAQSFHSQDLIRLGRVHQATEIGRAVLGARQAGFVNLSLDLMFGLPEQTTTAWQKNLELALSLKPEHLSLYCLTIEPNTRFYRLHTKGMMGLPDDEVQVQMYDQAVAATERAGLAQYEISNFAKPGMESQHNLCYWRAEEYLSYGPGAVGCYGVGGYNRQRYTNMKHPERYCEAVEQGAKLWCDEELLGPETLETERIMLGIRLNGGLDIGASDHHSVEKLIARGWIKVQGDRATLTRQGRHFCSEVAVELMRAHEMAAK